MLFSNETLFRNAVHQWLTENKIMSQRIESGGVDVGIPDLFFANLEPRMSGWLELKNLGRLDDVVRVPFRPGQLLWLKRFSKAGLYCGVAIAHDLGVSLFSGAFLQPLYSKSTMLSHCCQADANSFVKLLKGDYLYEQEHTYFASVARDAGELRDECGHTIYRDFSADDLDPN